MRLAYAVLWAVAALALVGAAVPLYMIVRPTGRAIWGAVEIAGVILFFAGTLPLAGLLLPHAAAASPPPFWLIVTLALGQDAVFVAAALYLAAVKYRLPIAELGLRIDRARTRAAQSLAGAVAAVVGNGLGQNATIGLLALNMGRDAASKYVTGEEQRSPIYRMLPQLHPGVEITVLALVVAVAVPIGEEIFFRGLVLGALRRSLNRHLAVAVSALFFAAAHLQVVELLPILILGLVLGYLYEFSGSIVPGMVAHGLNNLAALFLFYQAPTIGP